MNTYKRHRFPPDIISYAVWLYFRFNLSHRDIEDLLAERGIIVSREAIRLWCNKFGALYSRRLKRKHRGYGDTFYIDEVFAGYAPRLTQMARWLTFTYKQSVMGLLQNWKCLALGYRAFFYRHYLDQLSYGGADKVIIIMFDIVFTGKHDFNNSARRLEQKSSVIPHCLRRGGLLTKIHQIAGPHSYHHCHIACQGSFQYG